MKLFIQADIHLFISVLRLPLWLTALSDFHFTSLHWAYSQPLYLCCLCFTVLKNALRSFLPTAMPWAPNSGFPCLPWKGDWKAISSLDDSMLICNRQNVLSHILRRHSFTCRWKRLSLNPKLPSDSQTCYLIVAGHVHLLLQFPSSSFSLALCLRRLTLRTSSVGTLALWLQLGSVNERHPERGRQGNIKGIYSPGSSPPAPIWLRPSTVPLPRAIAPVGQFSLKELSFLPLSLSP